MKGPKHHRPFVVCGILLGVVANAITLSWLTQSWGFVLGAQLVVSVAVLIATANRFYWATTAAVVGSVAAILLWTGVRFAPRGGIETLTAAELAGREAFGFIVTDGRLLVDRQVTASFEEEEGCHQNPGEDCFVTYEYTAVAVVGDAWREGEPIPAWVVARRTLSEQTDQTMKRGSVRELPAPPPEFPPRISGALRRGAVDEPSRPDAASEESKRRTVAHAQEQLGLRSLPGAPLLQPSRDPADVLETDARTADWARNIAWALTATCVLVVFGSFARARRAGSAARPSS